ncbi:hypothetical protein Tco_1054586 [Tanacetum coccineum]|uniref:Uncharacterized protein n=1 Tax=Tanacetum coccineum TaxID=301880 RepID=A0ABQ5GXM1_9ASTR
MILRLFSDLLCSSIRLIVDLASLAYLKLSLGSCIYRVWNLMDTPYRAMWIRRMLSAGYAVLGLDLTRFLVKCRCGYAVSSLLDTAYRVSISNLQISSFKLQNVRLLACLHNVLYNYCN